jgi:HprK-related kinase A
MPVIADVPHPELSRRLAEEGLVVRVGAARFRIHSDVHEIVAPLATVYGRFPMGPSSGFCDVTASVLRVRGLRRRLRPQVEFVVDGRVPFAPFPASVHLPLLEWGLNYAFTERCTHYLLLHSGTVERDGVGIVMPAVPGSGKSTLTAGMVGSGRFRLLSDEFGVVSLDTGLLHPMPRPIALKNASIHVIRSRFPEATLGPVFPGTRKGDVAHMAANDASVAAIDHPVQPRLVLFPKFQSRASLSVEAIDPVQAFSKLTANSFNYELLGAAAFDSVDALVRRCVCRRLVFGDLDEAIGAIERLVDDISAGRVSAGE